MTAIREQYGDARELVVRAREQIARQEMVARIWRHDHTLWREDPTDITNRLGWLGSPGVMRAAVPELEAFAREVNADGSTHALLLGMGGSSLAAEVLRRILGVREGFLDLEILDSTDPATVRARWLRSDPARTLYIVATKSGGTVETLSFFKYFYTRVRDELGPQRARNRFVAITDPGSDLEGLARDLRFRRIFRNDPDIGGRFAALSYFGLVPAALIGADLGALLDDAARMAQACQQVASDAGSENPAVPLAAAMAALARGGRDKLTLIGSPRLAPFGHWIEQLVAESTGKEGQGILPIVADPCRDLDRLGRDRFFVDLQLAGDAPGDPAADAVAAAGHPLLTIALQEVAQLGGEFFRWEMATALAGALLGIQPFDQPDVQAAKTQAGEMVAAYLREGTLPADPPLVSTGELQVYAPFDVTSPRDALQQLLAGARTGGPRGYVAIQAYLPEDPTIAALLEDLRQRLQQRTRLAATIGMGPRYLHSTGQLHKGDAGHGLFVQITADATEDVAIPEEPGVATSSLSFGVLERAQAFGDRRALQEAGRPVVRFDLGRDPLGGLRALQEAVGE